LFHRSHNHVLDVFGGVGIMLQEVNQVGQARGEPFRRWFTDNAFDLIVWHGANHRITGFQLCYREGREQKALTWQQKSGFTHHRVDDGEGRVFRPKMTPILVPDGEFKRDRVIALFESESAAIDPEIARLVIRTLGTYPEKPNSDS
jgi:hypothetical protein